MFGKREEDGVEQKSIQAFEMGSEHLYCDFNAVLDTWMDIQYRGLLLSLGFPCLEEGWHSDSAKERCPFGCHH